MQKIIGSITVCGLLWQCVSPPQTYEANVAPKVELPMTSTNEAGLETSFQIFHPSIYPFESTLKKVASGEVGAAFSDLQWKYIGSNYQSDLLEHLIDEGYAPALVSVKNTSSKPIPMAGVELQLTDHHHAHPMILNEDLPTEFSKIDWATVGENTKDIMVFTAGVVVVAAAFYFLAVEVLPKNPDLIHFIPHVHIAGQVGVVTDLPGVGCDGGFPIIGKYEWNNVSRSDYGRLRSYCYKEHHAIKLDPKRTKKTTADIQLDYQSSLLSESKVLYPGETLTGLKFFKLSKNLVDWENLAVEGSTGLLPMTADMLQSQKYQPGVHFHQTSFKYKKYDLRANIKPMSISQCHTNDEGFFAMKFSDAYGHKTQTQHLTIQFEQGLPIKGKTYRFNASNSDQQVNLFLSSRLGPMNGAWRSYVNGGGQSACKFELQEHLKKIPMARGQTQDLLIGNVECSRLADWDYHNTKNALSMSAQVGCWVNSSISQVQTKSLQRTETAQAK